MSIHTRPSRGFTLLELLVVVAVIGLLLAILIPALSAATEAGRSVVCANNESNLLKGAIAYQDEYDGLLPWYAFSNLRPEGEEYWITQVARSMDNFDPRVYVCPSDPVPYRVPVYIFNGLVYMNDGHCCTFEMSAAPNDVPVRPEHAGGRCLWWEATYKGICTHFIDGGGFNTPPRVARRNTEFARPEKAIIFVEGSNWHQEHGVYVRDQMCAWDVERIVRTGKRRMIYPSWERHFGTTNVGFLDGHVEQLDPVSMATLSLAWQEQMVPAFKENYRTGPGKTKPPG